MRAVWVLPLVAGPVLASCAFLLDFDSLKGGDADASVGGAGATGGTSGAAGTSTGGQSGGGGDGGGGLVGPDAGIECTEANAATACNDGDQCTTDACYVPDGGSGRCISVGQLFEDGDVAYPIPNLVRVTVAGGNGRFFFSFFSSALAQPSFAEIHSMPVSSNFDFNQMISLTPSGTDEARSAAGMVVTPSGMTAFYAAAPKIALTDQVLQVEFNTNLMPTSGLPIGKLGDYDLLPVERYPIAFIHPTTGKPTALWSSNNGIWMGNSAGTKLEISGKPVKGVGLLLSSTHAGALWWDEATRNTYATMIGGTQTPITACEDTAAEFEGPSTSGAGRWWLGAVRRFYNSPQKSQVEYTSFFCEGGMCSELSNCHESQATLPNAGQPGVIGFTRGSPKAGFDRVYFISAVPFGKTLTVGGNYADFSQGGTPTLDHYGVLEAEKPILALPTATGVMRPALAFVDDRLFVAWIEPNGAPTPDAGIRDALRIRRYKFCP